jgi:hypothetical protein
MGRYEFSFELIQDEIWLVMKDMSDGSVIKYPVTEKLLPVVDGYMDIKLGL